MIRRVVEYIIVCDADRLGRECFTGAMAFDARSAEECAKGARRDGWTQISKRLWLCPECSPERTEEK